MIRDLSSSEVCVVAGVPASTLNSWAVAGVLGPKKAVRAGQGNGRTYTPVETLAVAAGILWARNGADVGRIIDVVRFIARQHLERLETEFAAGRTFPVPAVMFHGFEVPGTGGFFIEPEARGGAAKVMGDLDLRRLWQEVQKRIAVLGNPPRRGRKPKVVKL